MWVTPTNAEPASVKRYVLDVPNDAEWLSAFWGALDDLRYVVNWEDVGGQPVEDVAAAYAVLYDKWRMPSPLVGTIFAYASSSTPSGSLACDGATYNRSDYPDLYDSLDAAYRIGSTQFFTPDLRGRTLVGDGTGTGLTNRAFASQFGAETHVLTQAQLASHAHVGAQYLVTPSPAVVGPVPASLVVQTGPNTGATGGNAAHNNMQPSLALHYGIWFR